MYSELLENPRRRRRRSRRKGARSRRRRRSNPFGQAGGGMLRTNPRRRRRARSRRRGGSRSRRRNPFKIPGLGGALGQTLGAGGRLWLFEIAGGAGVRALTKLLPAAQQTQTMFRLLRAGLGVLAPMLLGRFVGRQWAIEFGSVQVAQALRNWSSNSPMFQRLLPGLGDYVTTEDGTMLGLADDYGVMDNGDDGELLVDEQGNVMLGDFVTVPEYA